MGRLARLAAAFFLVVVAAGCNSAADNGSGAGASAESRLSHWVGKMRSELLASPFWRQYCENDRKGIDCYVNGMVRAGDCSGGRCDAAGYAHADCDVTFWIGAKNSITRFSKDGECPF